MTAMARSDYGVMTDRAEPWEYRAACRDEHHLVDTATMRPNGGGPNTSALRLAHLCHQHCPVRIQCTARAQVDPPIGLVQAAAMWPDHSGRKTPVLLRDIGCGPHCADRRFEIPAWKAVA